MSTFLVALASSLTIIAADSPKYGQLKGRILDNEKIWFWYILKMIIWKTDKIFTGLRLQKIIVVMYSLPNRWRKVGFLKLLFIPFGKVGSYSAQAYLCYTQI